MSASMEQDNAQLKKQVAHLTSLHDRLQAKIAELIECPDFAAEVRATVLDPDACAPLLAEYDKELALKDRTINKLREEVAVLRGVLERRDSAGHEAGVAARTAEQRAQLHVDEADAKMGASDAVVGQLRKQLVQYKQELSIAQDRIQGLLIAEGHTKDECKRLSIVTEEQTAMARAALDGRADAVQEADSLRRKLAAAVQADEEGKAAVEGHKIQLHLAARENDDKVQELERLRAKMSQALKQSSENHVQHLKLVEEKHRAAVESQREEIRAQEAVIVKLRAQLARADWLHGAAKANDSAMTLVDSHTRVAQEQEIKRLYAEVSALTAQRDEAVFRLEAAASGRKSDIDDKVRQARKDADDLRLRVRELQERLSVLQTENSRVHEEARLGRDECRAAQSDKLRLLNEKQELMRAADGARRDKVVAEEAAESGAEEGKRQLEAERRIVRTLERRLSDMRAEHQQLSDRLTAEADDWRRQFEQAQSSLREASAKAGELRTALSERDKSVEALGVKCERLTAGLQAHRSKLVNVDARLHTTSQRESQLLEELHSSQLQLEQARLTAARCERDRDRMEREVVQLSAQLQMLTRSAYHHQQSSGSGSGRDKSKSSSSRHQQHRSSSESKKSRHSRRHHHAEAADDHTNAAEAAGLVSSGDGTTGHGAAQE